MGRMSIIPGTAGVVIPGAPRIVMTDYEKQVASLPGLLHYIDPGTLDAQGAGRERFNGALISPKGSGNAKVANLSGANNQPVISVPSKANGLRVAPGSVNPGYTLICAAMLTVKNSGESYNLFTAYDGAAFGMSYRVGTNGQLQFLTRNGATDVNTINAMWTPAANVMAIWGVSYDYATQESAILYDKGTQLYMFTHTTREDPTALDQWGYGSSGDSAAGIIGNLGACMIFDRPLHKQTEQPFMLQAAALLKGKYAIV